MKIATSGALGLAALVLTACGGGGGGAPTITKTSISGLVTPPAIVGNGTATPSNKIFTPPNSTGSWSAVVQSSNYTFDVKAATAVPATLKVNAMVIKPVDTRTGSFSVTTGAAYPTDLGTGQTVSVTNTVAGTSTISNGAVITKSTMGGLPATVLINSLMPAQPTIQGYVLPYSPVLNPLGYAYQTIGAWVTRNSATGQFTEHYFSAGAISSPTSLPIAGTASYSGTASGSWVKAATRDQSDTVATMNAAANFAARSVAFSTTGTTSLSANAAAGTLPSASPGLNMSGTLSYAAGSNTFTGAVSTANGMAGNATGRFYGPGIIAATPNQVLGAPPEIGGTFAVMAPGLGGMQGAFGGSGSHPPTIVPIPTIMSGSTTPLAPLPGTAPILTLPNVLLPINTSGTWRAVQQEAVYQSDSASATTPNQKISSLGFAPANTNPSTSLTIMTSATAYLADPTLGQAAWVSATTGILADALAGPLSRTVLAGLPAASITNNAVITLSYVLPYSPTLNPAGYTYQTFGSWSEPRNVGITGVVATSEVYFSAGAVTPVGTLPALGTARYTGVAGGSYVNAITNDLSHTSATMNATANFATRSLAFSTTGTTSLLNNATAGTLPTANAGLNMTGTLRYVAGSNTFAGAITTANGMSGNATGRFYGSGIAAATPTKAIGAPPEIGGTFAVMAAAVGAMQGAFGGK